MTQNNYAHLPSYILRTDLTDGDKIFCAVIDSYAKQYQSCKLKNDALAKMLNKTERAIQERVKKLYKLGVIENVGTHHHRELRLTYLTKPDIKELREDEEKSETEKKKEANWEEFWRIQVKKEAKAAARKRFMRLSIKDQKMAISAYRQYIENLEDKKYAVFGRTFLKDEYWRDETYSGSGAKEEDVTPQKSEDDQKFDIFFQKASELAVAASKNKDIRKVSFAKISRNEAAVFDAREVHCLESAVTHMDGLVDQSYDTANLRSLLRAFW